MFSQLSAAGKAQAEQAISGIVGKPSAGERSNQVGVAKQQKLGRSWKYERGPKAIAAACGFKTRSGRHSKTSEACLLKP